MGDGAPVGMVAHPKIIEKYKKVRATVFDNLTFKYSKFILFQLRNDVILTFQLYIAVHMGGKLSLKTHSSLSPLDAHGDGRVIRERRCDAWSRR